MIFDPFIIESFFYFTNLNLVDNCIVIDDLSCLGLWKDFIYFFYPNWEKIDVYYDLFDNEFYIPDEELELYNCTVIFEISDVVDYFYYLYFSSFVFIITCVIFFFIRF